MLGIGYFSPMAARNVEAQIEQLSRLRMGVAAEAVAPLRKALTDRVNLVVAKAATIAGELLLRELEPDLVRTFERLLEDPAKRDPQCWGKNAIAKALKELEYRESALFLCGASHVQMEPVWGGQADTAVTLRGICLLALVTCAGLERSEILRRLVDGLTDGAAPVRADAARALAQMSGEECALLLRLKARLGDSEPMVTGQALESLLALERKQALPFVAEFLSPLGGEIAEEAALALAASRMAAAVSLLRDVWSRTRAAEFRAALLRALCISRDEQALAFLEDLATNGPQQDAADARAALALLGDSGARNG
jgi:HEAT repeat protein